MGLVLLLRVVRVRELLGAGRGGRLTPSAKSEASDSRAKRRVICFMTDTPHDVFVPLGGDCKGRFSRRFRIDRVFSDLLESSPRRARTSDPTPFFTPEAGLGALFGVHDENLRLLEDAFGVEIAAARAGSLRLGRPRRNRLAARSSGFREAHRRGYVPKSPTRGRGPHPARALDLLVDFSRTACRPRAPARWSPRNVRSRSAGRPRPRHRVRDGPAGTGKTYLAVAVAAAASREEGQASCSAAPRWRARSSASAGRLAEKVNPYLRRCTIALWLTSSATRRSAGCSSATSSRWPSGVHARPRSTTRS